MVAKVQDVKTIALTGEHGGKMSELFDAVIKVPAGKKDEVQRMHSAVYHLICVMLKWERWGE